MKSEQIMNALLEMPDVGVLRYTWGNGITESWVVEKGESKFFSREYLYFGINITRIFEKDKSANRI